MRLGSHAVLVCCLAAAAHGQEPYLDVDVPAEVLELESEVDVAVSGLGFDNATPALAVYDNGRDVTSQVSITLNSESRVDANGDGILESYEGDFTLAPGGYDLVPGHVLVFRATAAAGSGVLEGQGSSTVRSNLAVTVDSVVFWEENVHVAVETRWMRVASQTLRVYLGGTEVTSSLSITRPETAYEDVDTSSPALVRYRMQRYYVDLGALGPFSGRLTFVAAATTPSGATSSGSAATEPAGGAGEPSDCHKDALQKFVDALGLSGTAGGAISSSATLEQRKAAADTLQGDLAECATAFPGKATFTSTGPGGYKLLVAVGTNGDDATASGKVDVVVALGGDAASASSADGGDATAKNTQPGGLALAIGGNGGSGASNAGDGGAGNAVAQPASSGSPSQNQATGIGGNGGTPSPASGVGGNGGTGSAQVGGYNGTAPGSQGSAGFHGGGGFCQITGSVGYWGPFAN